MKTHKWTSDKFSPISLETASICWYHSFRLSAVSLGGYFNLCTDKHR